MKLYNIHWFRRDLRLNDNHALFKALNSDFPVIPVFIFDKEILSKLPANDRRVTFIYKEIEAIKQKLNDLGSELLVFHESPIEAFNLICQDFRIKTVFCNEDYEPYALERDKSVSSFLGQQGINLVQCKDHLIHHKSEVLKSDGTPYTVYTPYSKIWKQKLADNMSSLDAFPSEHQLDNLWKTDNSGNQNTGILSLADMGFEGSGVVWPTKSLGKNLLNTYATQRDIPSASGTSKMGVHLRFGTVSIRALGKMALDTSSVYLNELIWREFYSMILYHFPHVVVGPFRKKYENIKWHNSEEDFELWKNGLTGIPIVDAGMRELKETGYMHNRVRMIVASFLTKNLLIDWRWGEQHFANLLLDFDLASNNGGWQWAAGTGTDAAPYFRIFNPETQQKKFDPEFLYVKKWVPEFGTVDYPKPMVDLKSSRLRALERYKEGLQ